MSNDQPQWAKEMAEKIELGRPSHERGYIGDVPNLVSVKAISQALLAAEQRGAERAAAHLEAMAKATPLGDESVQRGRSTYNWLTYCASAIRSLETSE